MKVSELIAELQKLNPDLDVMLATDEEGNDFETVSSVADNFIWDKKNRELKHKELTSELIAHGFTDEDIYHGKRGIEVIVLWP